MPQFQEYPKCKYHYTGRTIEVKTADEEAKLELQGGWANTPGAFLKYQGPWRLGPQHDPTKWVDQWSVEGLSEALRKKIKAQLLKAHAAFWKAPDAPNANTDAMRQAFDGVAGAVFEAGLLSEPCLAEYIPQLVWDSAIAGGWWRLASDTPQSMFPERLGQYWVWRDESRDWNLLFAPEAAEWQAKLLESSECNSNPTGLSKARRERTESVTAATASARAQKWEDVQIMFLSDERVQISTLGATETRNYAEMGFGDQRNGKPSTAWRILRTLAESQGCLPLNRGAQGWAAHEKHIERTRKLLRNHFGIAADPLPLEKGTGYQARFKIACGSSFDK